jgi:hypothetical protein
MVELMVIVIVIVIESVATFGNNVIAELKADYSNVFIIVINKALYNLRLRRGGILLSSIEIIESKFLSIVRGFRPPYLLRPSLCGGLRQPLGI